MQPSIIGQVNLEYDFGQTKSKGFTGSTDLCHLMTAFGSDKAHPFHNYTVVYDRLFSRFRNAKLTILEIGLGTNKPGAPSSIGANGKPGASLRGWQAYFPEFEIYGADIDSDILFEEDRIKTFWTDQRDPYAIRSLWEKIGDIAFDIIVDDGLHEASANICFFMESFVKLKSGGIYVVEDVTRHDADVLGAFVSCIKSVCKIVVFEELDHPLNKGDNRLVIIQKA